MTEVEITRSWKLLFHITDGLRTQNYRRKSPEERVTLGKLRVMGCLFGHGSQSLMLKEIAEKFQITPGAVSQTVDTLVREGLVERVVSTEDRRAVCIRLTEAGLNKRNELDAFFDTLMRELLADIPREKQEVFFEVGQALHDKLQRLF